MTTDTERIPTIGERVRVLHCLYDWSDHNGQIGVVTGVHEDAELGPDWTVELRNDHCWAVAVERVGGEESHE